MGSEREQCPTCKGRGYHVQGVCNVMCLGCYGRGFLTSETELLRAAEERAKLERARYRAAMAEKEPLRAEIRTKDAEIARLRTALEWYAETCATACLTHASARFRDAPAANQALRDDAGARACAALEGE